MALQEIPFERRIPPTDSNTSTGFDNLLIDNFFKKVTPKSKYQTIDAQTVKNYGESAESSTTKYINSDLLVQQASSIFASAKEDIFEDGMESNFSRNLIDFITTYGHFAMETIIPIILSAQINTEIASEAFRVIGRFGNKTTYRDRLWLLETGLYSNSARVRDGATLGLAFLNDPLAIAPLKSAIERELISELRQDMEQVLAQLEGKHGIYSKKNTEE